MKTNPIEQARLMFPVGSRVDISTLADTAAAQIRKGTVRNHDLNVEGKILVRVLLDGTAILIPFFLHELEPEKK